MPLGNGAPGGLPSLPLSVLADKRLYNYHFDSSSNTGSSSITYASPGGQLGVYERVVASTPGLSQWFPLYESRNGASGKQIMSAAGGNTLFATGTGTESFVAGIVPGSRNKAIHLPSGRTLNELNYDAWAMSGHEINMTLEFWVQFSSLSNSAGLVGQWDSNNGYLVQTTGGDGSGIRMLTTGNVLASGTGALKAGVPLHIVAVWGGSATPPDYISRLYVNGQQVASGTLVNSGANVYDTAGPFQVNSYASGAGTSPSATYQHIAIYNRMLQPIEVAQHYAAGFARA